MTMRAIVGGGALVLVAAAVGGMTAGPALADAAKYVLVRSVDEPGRKAHQEHRWVTCNNPGNCAALFTPVSPGSRLVVTHVSATFTTTSAAAPALAWLTEQGGDSVSQYLHVSSVAGQGSRRVFVINEPVRMHFDAGQIPRFDLFIDDANYVLQQNFVISGYLVDMP